MSDGTSAASEKQTGPELVITRVFDAPRELIWKSWTDPDHLKNWWGPKAFTMLVCNVTLRPDGGVFHYCMKSPQGAEMWGQVCLS